MAASPTTWTTRQWITVAGIATVSIAFAVVWFTGLSRLLNAPAPAPDAPAADAPAATATPEEPAAVPKIKATLYFASEDGMRLVPAEQEVRLGSGVRPATA